MGVESHLKYIEISIEIQMLKYSQEITMKCSAKDVYDLEDKNISYPSFTKQFVRTWSEYLEFLLKFQYLSIEILHLYPVLK